MPKPRESRPMTPDDIRRQVVVEEHAISADGRFAVVVRRFVRRNRYESHLWLVPLQASGGPTRRLTGGAVRDTQPRISPDGTRVAFRRRRYAGEDGSDTTGGDKHVELSVVEIGGGEPWTPRRVGWDAAPVSELAWSPDGTRIAFTAAAGPPRFIVGPAARKRAARKGVASHVAVADESPRARRITRIDWRWDDEGHRDRWDHLFVVRVGRRSGGAARPHQLTAGDFGVSGLAWHPGGTAIAFVSDRGREADIHPRTTIWSVSARPSATAEGQVRGLCEPREILAPGGWATAPAFSPDGRWVAAIGVVEPEPLDDVIPGIVVGPAAGSAPAVALAPTLDRPIGVWQDTDLNGWLTSSRGGPTWADDRTIVALVTERGRSVPWRFPIDPATGRAAGDPEPLVSADSASWTLGVAPAHGSSGNIKGTNSEGGGRRHTVSVVGTLDGRAMELMTVEARGSSPRLRTRTTIGSSWQRGLIQPEMRLLAAPGAGGPIDVWLASPPSAGTNGPPLPTVVDIHGGPLGAWSPAPSIEVSLLVSRGYRVILPNIRGSASYGRAWIRPQLGDWGGVDAADVHSAVDHVVEFGLADRERLGLLGLSYGGFMVNWLIATSDRFRAAVSENGVTNQINDWANSDSGPEYDRASLLGDPLTEAGMLRLWRQSPLAHVANVRTPLLMFQGEADLRCPAADNEQFFIALRWLGREVEYVLYPDESHTFAITGRPDRRIDRMTRMLEWFDRHLAEAR